MSAPLRLLIVEDSEDDALLIAHELSRGGYELTVERVDTAHTMRLALEGRTWDVIIADYSLPSFSGLEALELAQARGLDIPFILVSGTIGEDIAVAAMKAGAHDYVMKDKLARLLPAVERELQEVQVRRARLRAEEQARRRAENLLAISRLAIECASAGPETNLYALIGEKLKAITHSLAVGILSCNPAKKFLTIESIAASSEVLDPVDKLLGRSLVGMKLPIDAELLAIFISNVVAHSYDLAQIFPGVFPESFSEVIRDTIGGGAITSVGLQYGGELVGVIGVLSPKGQPPPSKDLTETMASVLAVSLRRKRAEDALRESEERFRSIFENAPIGIYRTTPDGRVLMANPSMIHMLGFASFEDLAQLDLESEEYFTSYTRADFKQRVESEAGNVSFESIWTKKDGGLVRVRENARAVRDEHGDVVYYEGTAEDVTQRYLVEEERERLLKEVQEQAQQIRWIVDTVPEGVLLLDETGKVVLANPLGERELRSLASVTLGDRLTRLGNRPLAELLAPPPKGLWHEVSQDKRSFQVIASPIETAARRIGWVLVVRDVTEQREVQQGVERQERLAAVGQLAAGIAHDFNNILATIILYAEMTTLAPGLPEDVRARMQTINEQAMHASKLIQQILDFSRRSMLERQPLDLLPLIKEQVKLLERALPENIELVFHYSQDEFTAYADLTRMQQMLTNLALNARDAMPDGGVLGFNLERFHVDDPSQAPLPEMQAGDWLKIQVSDTGTGFSPEAYTHIFEPFFTTKEPGKGTGLGLSQVHGIVGAHDGYIDVTTQPGQGTVFNIYLPALPLSTPQHDGRLPASFIRGNGETLLVVEDNLPTQAALLYSLETLNYRVLAAKNGEEALEMLEQHAGEIALVLSDVVMPVMGGLALLKAMQERSIGVKVILMTGHLLEHKPQDFETGEFPQLIGWLSKPVHVEQLAETIAKALEEKDLPG